MTVELLIKQLQNLPPDATVVMDNTELFVGGTYKITGVDYDNENNFVEILTDYEERLY